MSSSASLSTTQSAGEPAQRFAKSALRHLTQQAPGDKDLRNVGLVVMAS